MDSYESLQIAIAAADHRANVEKSAVPVYASREGTLTVGFSDSDAPAGSCCVYVALPED